MTEPTPTSESETTAILNDPEALLGIADGLVDTDPAGAELMRDLAFGVEPTPAANPSPFIADPLLVIRDYDEDELEVWDIREPDDTDGDAPISINGVHLTAKDVDDLVDVLLPFGTRPRIVEATDA